MAKERMFAAAPSRLVGDSRLTALEIRCMLAIALHDGMSKSSGKGAGCFAKSTTLAAEVGTDVTNFSKALSRLVALGYVVREPQLMDKRRFTLRVDYSPRESWRTDQQSTGAKVGEPTNNRPEKVGETTNDRRKVVGDGESENGSFSKKNGSDYIPLNGELDSVETDKLNSAEAAHLAFGEKRRWGVESVGGIVARGLEKNSAEAPAARKVSLKSLLPANFTKLPAGAMLQRWEEAFKGIGRDPERLQAGERRDLADFLNRIAADYIDDDAICNHAQRLFEELALWEA